MTPAQIPACLACRRYRGGSTPPACDAFPGRIPAAIWLGGDPHTAPVDGDGGLLYDPDLAAIARIGAESRRLLGESSP